METNKLKMNREIKFRAWDNVDYMSSPFILQDVQSRKIEFTSDCVVMQFTGLNDIKGNEVCEGDLLGIGDSTFGFITNQDNETVYYEVKTEGCDYILYRNDIQLTWGRLSRVEELGWNCTILGNIYQNPELLTP